MSDFAFFLSVGGVPVLVSGASPDDAARDPGAVACWDFGWADLPAEAAACTAAIAREQPFPPYFSDSEAHAVPVRGDKDVLLWEAERKVRGRLMPSWNQRRAGTCVSFGWARGGNDLVMQAAADGLIEAPASDLATEPVYALSRVEVGGGRISGDGSVGAWAAKAVRDWGMILRGVHGRYDLSEYSESLSRQWGRTGLPDDLEPVARQKPIRGVALVRTGQEAWDAGGSGYPVPVCSNRGFTSRYDQGFCDPSGSWNHCMVFRGRVTARRGGRLVRALPCQNSWGGYIQGERSYEDADGNRRELPEGCFLVDLEVADRMLRQADSFAVSSIEGFPRRERLEWLI